MSEVKVNNGLVCPGVHLDGTYYGVIKDYPFDKVAEKGPNALQKAVAYRYHREISIGGEIVRADYMLPFRKILDRHDPINGLKPGIYFRKMKHNEYKELIIRPRTPEEAEAYSPSQEKDIIFAMMTGEYLPNEFADNQLNLADIGTDVYLPPIHPDDDPLNMILKLAIRLKGAPFAPYGKRIEAQALNRKTKTEGANMRNNVRRAMWLNTSLSPNKMCQYADWWQFRTAIIIADCPDAMHPMRIPSGKMLVVFPNGAPFEINSEDLIDISDMISDAILSSSTEERSKKT